MLGIDVAYSVLMAVLTAAGLAAYTVLLFRAITLYLEYRSKTESAAMAATVVQRG